MLKVTLYYLALFALVFLVRYFKLKREATGSVQLSRVSWVSLEMTYTAAGFVVALLAAVDKSWIAPIVAAYLLVMFISSQLASLEEKFSPTGLTTSHLLIIAVVVGATVFSFSSKGSLAPPTVPASAAATEPSRPASFLVAVPYSDISLVDLLSSRRFGDRELLFRARVDNVANESEAIDKAKRSFWESTISEPVNNPKHLEKRLLVRLKADADFIVRSLSTPTTGPVTAPQSQTVRQP